MRLLILNGFDRSGTSFIGGLLSRHPQINYFFQPFSSTEIHRTQYQIWGSGYRAPAVKSFIRAIQDGRIEQGFITSDWFGRFSNYDLDGGRPVGIIKETKLHTKIDWLKNAFPEVAIYGIWRDPRAVLCSLLRNGFHLKWYGEPAFEATRALIRKDQRLDRFEPFLHEPLGEEARMALTFAARTQLMVSSLGPECWLRYEDVLTQPDEVLNGFCKQHGLDEFRFSDWCKDDYNVIGLPYQRQDVWKDYFRNGVPTQVSRIFNSLQPVLDAA